MANIRFETESLVLNNYAVENKSFASAGGLTRLTGNSGSISTTLGAGFSAGNYNVKVAYFDENDGQSQLEFFVDNGSVDAWTLDQDLPGSRASKANARVRELDTTVFLQPGSTLRLNGTLDRGEIARVDYIELVPVEGSTPTDPVPTPPGPTPPANTSPVAVADSATTAAETAVEINVLSNDSDADGDTLSIASFDANTGDGRVSLTSNGRLSYVPNAGFDGVDSFSYSISDGEGGSASSTVAVTVEAPVVMPPIVLPPIPIVDPPVAPPSTGSNPVKIEAEDMQLSGYSTEGGSFASGRQLIGVSRGGNSGTATTQFNGASGDYTLKVVYFDERDGKSSLGVKVNDGSGFRSVDSWVLDASTSSGRASAGNRRERTISNVSLTTGSQIQLEGVLERGERSRVDYIEIIPTDGGSAPTDPGPTDPGPTPLGPTPPANTSPVAVADSATTAAETAVEINVLSNDSDADGDTLNIASFDANTGDGRVSLTSNGRLSYVPNAGFDGVDSFSYSISDGEGGSASSTVAVTVEAPVVMPPIVLPPIPIVDPPVTPPSTGSNPVKIEAEDMQLSGYSTEGGSFASGRQLIGVSRGGNSGTATTQFNGASGDYTLKVVYFDERDGKSSLGVKVNDGSGFRSVDSWVLDASTSSGRASAGNRRERTISNVSLTTGSQIQLEGVLERGERSRVDYIEIIPTDGGSAPTDPGPTDPDPTPPAPSPDLSGGMIANLETGVRLSPRFGALSKPQLLPLGDSITAGEHRSGARPGSYRIQFWERAGNDAITIDFVGDRRNGPSSLGDKDHAGVSGRSIGQTTQWVKNNLSRLSTDAILLMIGTNDANGGSSPQQMIDRLSTLIDEITDIAPDTYLYVSSIPPIDEPRANAARSQNVRDYNSLIPGLVSSKASNGKRVLFADAGGRLSVGDINGDNSSTNDLNDGLHPTDAGYDVLGDAWYDAVYKPVSIAGQTNLTGTDFGDRLIGNGQRNVIEGKGGTDEIIGGGSADTFAYRRASHGGDRITDFSSDDRFSISASGFGGGLSANASLDGASFIFGSSPTATTNSGTFLYNTSSGTLSFDQDGLGGSGADVIATLTNSFALRANHFEIVA